MRLTEINEKYTTTNVRWGIVRNKNLSDQLDSATVVLTNVTAKDIEPYDLVRLGGEDGNNEIWLVANVNKEYVTYTTPFKFDYTLDLMSLTKWFETITLPSMSITNIGQNRSIKSYIQRVVDRYVVPELSNYIDGATYTGLDSRFDVVCPEMKFEQTNVREFLDWMVGQFGCVISATFSSGNLNIGVLDLNQDVGLLPTEYIDDIKEMNSAQEYVTQFEHNMQDVIGQEPITEYVTLKGDGYIFNSDNAVAVLSHKPYDILKVVVKSELTLKIRFSYSEGGTSGDVTNTRTISNVDITRYVVEENIFNTLEMPPHLDESRTVIVLNQNLTTPIGTLYKINALNWSRGNTKITNFNFSQEFRVILQNQTTPPAICSAIVEGWLEENWTRNERFYSYEENYKIDDYEWSNLVLEITYVPYISPRLLVEQKDNFRHLITMQDNSTNTQTELGKFLSYSLEKNSKLGNNSKIITAMSTVENGDYTPKFAIGQTWTDEDSNKYVLSTLEYSIFKNSILYKGTLTKNYTNRNINTIINREKRYFSLPDPSEIVERKEITKEWYNIQLFSNYSGSAITISNLFEKPLFALFYAFYNNDELNVGSAGTLYVDSVYGGNLISHNVSFADNISYATSVSEVTTDGYKMNVMKYVDDNGELTKLSFRFGKSDGTNQENFYKGLAVGELNLGYTMLWDWYSMELLKDSRERISWSLERIFYSDNSRVKLGNSFAELFQDKTKQVYVSFTYMQNDMTYQEGGLVTVNNLFTTSTWSQVLPSGKTGYLVIKESNNANATVYLKVFSFNAGDYFVFTTGSKRG